MAEQAEQLINTVLRRVYDEAGFGTDRDTVRAFLDRLQQLLNARYGWALTSVAFTLQPRQLVYATADVALDVAKIVAVYVEGEKLPAVDWRGLSRYNGQWFRAVRGMPYAWAPIGLESFCVYPAPQVQRTATIQYASITTPLSSEDTATVIRDDRLKMLLALAEIVVLARGRAFAPLKGLLEKVAKEAVGG